MTQYAPVVELSQLDGHNGYRIDGGANYDAGRAVAQAGDVNGDGFSDLIIGATGGPRDRANGASYVVFGSASNSEPLRDLSSLDGTNGFRIGGTSYRGHSGASVASAGDVNGDGFDDVIVGSPFASPRGIPYSGASYVVFGRASGFNPLLEASELDGHNGFRIAGNATDDRCGISVASAGDFNGDGLSDVVVGAPEAGPHGGSGRAYVIFGSVAGFKPWFDLASLDGTNGFEIDGEHKWDDAGCSVASAGDVNRDGFDDLIVGARSSDPNGESSGTSYIVFGSASGVEATLDLRSIRGHNGFRIDGEDGSDLSGQSVASAGDVNGDGNLDLLIGAANADPNGRASGTSYVVFGRASGFGPSWELSSLDGNNGFQMNGEAAGDFAGCFVGPAGDFNGDGYDDVIVGSSRGSGSQPGIPGAFYVVFGMASGFTEALELSSLDGNNGFKVENHDGFLNSAASAGDLNGDGFADVMVGVTSAGADGSCYIIFGHKPGEAVVRTGTDIANTIHGGDFDDHLSGLGGNDTLIAHDGNDLLSGGDGGDSLFGRAGDDMLSGGAGADTMRGGEGADLFSFASATDSTGPLYDTVTAADLADDKWDAALSVADTDAAISGGRLSRSHFDVDLASAADAAHLGAHHAVLFTPDSGGLAGTTLLIIDQNGVAGYQAGEDLVIRLKDAVNVGSLDAGDFI